MSDASFPSSSGDSGLRQAAQRAREFLQDKSFHPPADNNLCSEIVDALDAALEDLSPQAQAGETDDLWSKVGAAEIARLRSIAQGPVERGKPVAYTNAAQLGFLKDPKFAEIPMAMWAESHDTRCIPLYASPGVETVAWLPVPEFEELYEVSASGDIRSIKSGKIIGKPLAGDGYAKAELWKDNQRTQTYHHRIVARAFLGEPHPDFPEINHKDGDKLNNAISNLEWVSRGGNVRHAMYELGANVKPVIATGDDGSEEYYPSIRDAGRRGYSATGIYKCLYGQRNKHAGKTWRFAASPPAPLQAGEPADLDKLIVRNAVLRKAVEASQAALADGGIERTPFVDEALRLIDAALSMSSTTFGGEAK